MNILKVSGQVALANTAVYSISLLTSKEKMGGMTAGAKTMVTCWIGVNDGDSWWKNSGADGCAIANPSGCNPITTTDPPGCNN